MHKVCLHMLLSHSRCSCMHVCIYVVYKYILYVCMYVFLYVCMYVCMYVHIVLKTCTMCGNDKLMKQ
jgi:hypothetical protein